MRKKQFFSKLDEELSSMLPDMSEELKSTPITLSDTTSAEQNGGVAEQGLLTTVKNWLTPVRLGALATALVVALIGVFGVIHFTAGNSGAGRMVVQMDINPSVSLLVDGNGLVDDVISNNADGDLVLADGQFVNALIGVPLKEGVTKIAQKAKDLGYIDGNNVGSENDYNAVKLSVYAEGGYDEDLFKEISQSVSQHFMQEGVYLFVEYGERVQSQFGEYYEQIKQGAHLYYNKIESDLTALVEYASETIYQYCNLLLEQSLDRYDCYRQINDLNERIIEAVGTGYWTLKDIQDDNVLSLKEQMSELLERLFLLHDTDMRETGIINGAINEMAVSAYLAQMEAIDIPALRELASRGVDSSLFDIGNNQLALSYAAFVADGFISDIINMSKELISSKKEEILSQIQLVNQKLDGLMQALSESFTQIEAITQEEYEQFLSRIGKK